MNINIRSAYDKESVFVGAESVPVLRGLPGIGVALQLHKNPINFFSETVNRYGDRVELRGLGWRVLLLTNPADVKAVLIQNGADVGRSSEVNDLRAAFGNCISSSKGERWRRKRSVVH